MKSSLSQLGFSITRPTAGRADTNRNRQPFRRWLLESLEDRRLMAVASIGGASDDGDSYPTMLWRCAEVEYRPGGWIVGIDNAGSVKLDALVEASLGAATVHPALPPHPITSQRGLGSGKQAFIEADASINIDHLTKAFSKLPGFRYVEPDFVIRVNSTMPNDPNATSLYGMDKINAFDAWDLATGATEGQPRIVAGVIDSGVDYTHPDLKANIWTNPGEIAGDGKDNDGNGYIDDVRGWDFANNDNDPMDDNGHGTHVSGTIAGVGNNGIGVAGVGWNTQIMPLKFLGANGSGAISAAVSALNYATNMHNRLVNPVNIKLTNNSWGGGGFSQAMSDALDANATAKMLFIAAAGNSAANNDTTTYYPQGYPQANIISVASSDQNDAMSSFSSYGATTVDLAAPGSSIFSTHLNGGYATMSGTSMATPHVAGAAALAWSAAPGASAVQIRDALLNNVDTLPAFEGKTVSGGRLNVANTIRFLQGDAGDTSGTARKTNLDVEGDQFREPGGAISTSTDVDLYRFEATAGAIFAAKTMTPAGKVVLPTRLRLLNSEGAELAVNSESAGNAQLSQTLSAAGAYLDNRVYYVEVTGISGATGDFALKMQLDVGDTLTTAKSMTFSDGTFAQYDTSLGDALAGGNDVDVYQFTPTSNVLLSAYTTQKSGGMESDTVLKLLSSAGSELASSDRASSLTANVDYRLSAGVTYFLTVSGAGNSRGDYTLKAVTSAISLSSAVEFSLQSLVASNGIQGTAISGTASYAELMGSSTPIGDINGDNIVDFALSEPGDIGAGPKGNVYLVFGKAGGLPANIDLTTLAGTSGYRIEGIAMYDRTGLILGDAGDVNKDGSSDLLIAAIAATSTSGLVDAGQTYVLFGNHWAALDGLDGASDGVIHLANLTSTLGRHGFTIDGGVAGGLSGRSSGIGDVNGDGYGDILVGTPVVKNAAGITTGLAHVVFGRSTFPSTIDLATINGTNRTDGFQIPPLANSGALGIRGSRAGDINGDGLDDFAIADYAADPDGVTNAGQVYVIYGKRGLEATGSLDLASLAGTTGFTISGSASYDNFGYGISYGGDVNGDTRGDLLIGAQGKDFNGRASAGAAYVVFGLAPGNNFPATIAAEAIEGTYGAVLIGPTANNYTYNVGYGGDFNGDLVNDIVIATSSASPNGVSGAGQTYVVYGGKALPSRLDLASLLVANGGDGTSGRVFNGYLTNSGMSAGSVGDVNNDGRADLRISAQYVSLQDNTAAGQVYIVYGQAMQPGVRVSPSTGLQTTEGSQAVTFTVVLNTQPTADVTIQLASSNVKEGTVSPAQLKFTYDNWNVPQTVTVSSVNDSISEGPIAYSIELKAATSDDPKYSGINPVDVSLLNLDNDTVHTRFYVVNDASPDRTYEYTAAGATAGNYVLNKGNTGPRGSATSLAGDKVWVVDSNRKVFVYNTSGTLLGSWTANLTWSTGQFEGIASNGTDVWLVDSKSDSVYRYTGGASFTTGTKYNNSSFPLNAANKNPKDITTDGTYLYVVNDSTTDQVFKYNLSGTLISSWTLSTPGVSAPTGIAVDPSKPADIWIVDSGSDRVYLYTSGVNQATGTSRAATSSFALGSGNTTPQGIALAPPVIFGLSSGGGNERASATSSASGQSASANSSSKSYSQKSLRVAASDEVFGSDDWDWLGQRMG